MVGANPLSAGGVTIERVAGEVGADDLVDVARVAFERAGERAVRQCGHRATTVAALRIAAHRCGDGDFDVEAACGAVGVDRCRVSHASELIEQDVTPSARIDDVVFLRREIAFVREALGDHEGGGAHPSADVSGGTEVSPSACERASPADGCGASATGVEGRLPDDGEVSIGDGGSAQRPPEHALEPGDEHCFEFTLGERDGRAVVDDPADANVVASMADLDEDDLRAHLRRLEADLEMAKLGVELYVHAMDEG